MTDITKLIQHLATMSNDEIRKAQIEALKMARHNISVCEACLGILAKRGDGLPRMAETIKLAKRVEAVG